jgi:hypothetical protein
MSYSKAIDFVGEDDDPADRKYGPAAVALERCVGVAVCVK